MREESEGKQGQGLDKFKELRDEDDAAAVVGGVVGVSGTVNGFELARISAGVGTGKGGKKVVGTVISEEYEQQQQQKEENVVHNILLQNTTICNSSSSTSPTTVTMDIV